MNIYHIRDIVKWWAMEDFGKRLKEERERLGLTQAEFAKACGVGKTAQYMYEKSERLPSISYLQDARLLGCDVLFLLTGNKSDSDAVYSRAKYYLLTRIELFLGLEDHLAFILHKYTDFIEDNEMKKFSGNIENDLSPWNAMIKKWLLTCRKPDTCIDVDLFSQILAEIETYADNKNIKLSAEKKVKALMVLYRIFKTSGKIEKSIIQETINLASP